MAKHSLRLSGLTTALLLMMVTFGQQAQAVDLYALQLYNQGVEASSVGNTPVASKLFERATRLDPTFADAQYNLGVCYYDMRQYDKAAQSFQHVLQRYPNDAQTRQSYQRSVTKAQQTAGTHPWQVANTGQVNAMQLSGQDRIKASPKPAYTNGKVAMAKAGFVKPSLYGGKKAVYSASAYNPTQVSAVYGASLGSGKGTSTLKLKPLNSSTRPSAMGAGYVPKMTKGPVLAAAAGSVARGSTGYGVGGLKKATAISTGHSGPTGMVMGPDNALYVANYLKNALYKVSTTSDTKALVTQEGLNGPIGLVWNPTRQEWYVANYKSNSVARIQRNGKASTLASNLHKPYMLLLDEPTQTLYVSEQASNSIARIKL
jgi:Tfp pilus assembly protein PilF